VGKRESRRAAFIKRQTTGRRFKSGVATFFAERPAFGLLAGELNG